MHFGDAAEEIVQIAHDVLVGAHHEQAEVINLAGMDPMQRQRFAHVLQVDELQTFPSESQVMSTSVPLRSGGVVSRWIGMIGNSWPSAQ